jgi:hypothetical protein
MAGWEEELAGILRKLGVEQEQSASHHSLIRKPTQRKNKWHEQTSDALPWGDLRESDVSDMGKDEEELWLVDEGEEVDEDDDIWMQDLELMRYEVDSIVNQVVRLMQHGGLAPSLKDDVMIVLHALRRRATATQQAARSDEAYLEFASAILHFCRLVLQLSEVASEE